MLQERINDRVIRIRRGLHIHEQQHESFKEFQDNQGSKDLVFHPPIQRVKC